MSVTMKFLLAAALLALACRATTARAQTIYNFTELGSFGGENYSSAAAINDAGQVVGSATYNTTNLDEYALLYSGGTLTNLGTLGGTYSAANGIDAAGQVVGIAATNASVRGLADAFLYSGGTMTDLGTLAGPYNYGSTANAINNAGQIVGAAYTTGDATSHAFLYNGGTMTDLGTLGGASSVANAINDAGQIVGQATTAGGATNAFLYASGAMKDLGTLGGTTSYATGINPEGQIVGAAYTTAGAEHAFLYSGGVMTDLGTLGGTFSYAHGINAAGQIVGESYITGNLGLYTHGFLYSGGTMTDLNSLPLANPDSGFLFSSAQAINDSGQIAGIGYDSGGVGHGYILTPLPTFGWTNAAGTGSWNSAANWSPAGGPPNGGGAAALFATTSPIGTVTLDGNQSVGVLQFNNGASGKGMTITAGSPAGTLTLDSGIAGGAATINVTAGQHTISAPMVLNQSVSINITTTTPGTGLTISGPISDGSQGNGISLSGGGTLTLSGANTYSGPTNINAGTLQTGAVNTIPSASTVTVGSGATLMLGGFSQTVYLLNGGGSVTNNSSAPATLTIVGDNYVASARTFSGVISDATGSAAGKLSLTVTVPVTLAGINTYSGTTTVDDEGDLTLDFSNLATPTNIVSPNSPLVLGGGYLMVADAPGSTPTLQTFNGTTINAPTSVTVNSSDGVGSALVLGSLTRYPGATVTFGLPSVGNITTTTPNTSGIIGPWALVGTSDWAANSGVGNPAGGFNIVAYSAYSYDYTSAAATTPTANYGWGPGKNTSTISTNATTTDAVAPGSTTNSLRFNMASDYTITLTGANTITSGGILVNGAGGSLAINGSGTLTVGSSARELAVTNSTDAILTISVAILDSGSGSTALTVTGDGSVALTNAGNTYSGITTVNLGYLQISADHDLGTPPGTAEPGAIVLSNLGTLSTTGTFTLNSNRGIALGPRVGGIQIIYGTLTYGGVIANNGAYPSALAVGAGIGTLVLTGANTYSGGTAIGGTLIISSDAALGATTGTPTITIDGTGSTLKLAGGFSGLALSSSRTIVLEGGGTFDTNGNGTAAVPITFAGGLVITEMFAKTGAGVFEIDSAPTLSTVDGADSISVGDGTLRLKYANAPSNLNNLSALVRVGATLELAGSISQLSNAVDVSNSGTLLVSSTAAQAVGTIAPYYQAGSPGATVVNAGSSLTAYQIIQNSLTIHGTGTGAGAAGSVTLVPSGSGSTANPTGANNINFSSTLSSLSIDNNGAAVGGGKTVYYGTLDIGNNGLVIAYGSSPDPYTSIDDMIRSGFDNGKWDGTGITSSLAAAAANSSTPLNIGLLDFTPGKKGDATFTVFEGQTITTNAILVRLTYMDDLALSGDMSPQDAASDALLFAANYGSGTTWDTGDLTHDGVVDSQDALLFAANYVTGLPSLDGTTGGAATFGGSSAALPEPASVLLAALAALGLSAAGIFRKQRRRKCGH